MSLNARYDNGKSSPLPQVADCKECGVCCLHMGYPPYIEGNDRQPPERYWTELPDDLRHELIQYRDSYQHPPEGQLDGPCFWFDIKTKQCKHHQYRPNVCRDFDIGCEGCLQWRQHYGITLTGSTQA